MEQGIEKAIADVSEIKRVMRLTAEDFKAAAKLFITAGVFWMAEGLLHAGNSLGFWYILPDSLTLGTKAMIGSYISQGISLIGFIVMLVLYLVCRMEQKKTAKGLGVQLIDLWGIVFLWIPLYGGVILRAVGVFSSERVVDYKNIGGFFLMAAVPFALMMSGILLHRAAPKWLALVDVVLTTIIALIPLEFEISLVEGVSTTLVLDFFLNTALLPGLFVLLMGIVLKCGKKCHA